MYPWENSEITGINTECSVVQSYHYINVDDALNEVNRSIISLNGRWKYKIFKNIHSVVENFHDKEYADSDWERVSVPSILKENNNEKRYKQNNYFDEINKNFSPKISRKSNRIIVYRKNFHVSKRHNTGEFYLCLEGMILSFNVYLNGNYIGYSNGKLTPTEFKVSENIIEGNNTICIEMVEFPDSNYLYNNKKSIIGIMRSVFIYYEPKLHIKDINLSYCFNEDLSNCNLEVLLKMRDARLELRNYRIEVMIGEYGEPPASVGEINCEDSKCEKTLGSEFILNNIKLWSSETPNLYNIIFKVVDDDNQIVTIKKQTIGFREIIIENNILMINRKLAELKGINAGNLFNKDYKYPENDKCFEEEVKRLKQFNINAIIINEYPYPEAFYRYCDIYGLYVVDEVEINCFNKRIGRRIVNDKEWFLLCKERVMSMIERGKNHASIIMWSLGRILDLGENIEKLHEIIKYHDNSRPVFYIGDNELVISDVFAAKEGTPNFQKITGELKELNYPINERIKNITKEFVTTPLVRYKNKPILYLSYGMFSNYSLGMINEHVNEFKKYENWVGGFLNIYSSPIIDDEENEKMIKEKSNNIIMEKGKLNPISYEIKKCFQSIQVERVSCEKLVFEIKNEYKFITTNNFDTVIKLIKGGEVLSTQVVNHAIIPANECCIIDLSNVDMNNKIKDFNQIDFSFVLNKNTRCYKIGTEVAWNQFQLENDIDELCSTSIDYNNHLSIGRKNNCIEEYKINSKPNNLKIENKNENYLITGNNFEVNVCKTTGNITLGNRENSNINNRNLIEIWAGRRYDSKKNNIILLKLLEKFKKRFSNAKRIIGQEIVLEENCIIISFIIKDKLLGCRFNEIYKIYDNGKVCCKYICCGVKNSKSFRVNINVPSEIDEFVWYGRGPYESYPWAKNGMKYGKFNIKLNKEEATHERRCDVSNIEFHLVNGIHNSVKFASEVDIVLKNYSGEERLDKASWSMDILSNEKVELSNKSILYYLKNNFKKNINKVIEFTIELGSDN